jgi:hypothetical protein
MVHLLSKCNKTYKMDGTYYNKFIWTSPSMISSQIATYYTSTQNSDTLVKVTVYVRNYIFTVYLFYMLLEKVLLRTFEPKGRK